MSISANLIEKINERAKQRSPFFLLVDFLVQNAELYSPHELQEAGIRVQFPQWRNDTEISTTQAISLHPTPLSFEAYQQSFSQVQEQLHYGNSFLTNLTVQTPLQCVSSMHEIFTASKARYKIQYKQQWVCFSPEIFVRIQNGRISSYPMKGTIDAAIPSAIEIILQDPKETAEHYTIVDLIRNDLSRVATQVAVKRFRYIDEITTASKKLYQVSSHIEGVLPVSYREELGNILFALLPAGSISGAPKVKTLEIINNTENYERGYYTGTAFYFDGENLDSCVLIRFIEQTEKGWVYKSGGGITIYSDARKEYQEILDKIYVPTL